MKRAAYFSTLPAQQALQADSWRGREPKAVLPLSYLLLEGKAVGERQLCSSKALWKCLARLEVHSPLLSLSRVVHFGEGIPCICLTCRGWYLCVRVVSVHPWCSFLPCYRCGCGTPLPLGLQSRSQGCSCCMGLARDSDTVVLVCWLRIFISQGFS